jgi:hypothetical protein
MRDNNSTLFLCVFSSHFQDDYGQEVERETEGDLSSVRSDEARQDSVRVVGWI